ncbi:DUF262 domain-containing protein [Saccharospirillum alexandrii]|uniref:GmrSD restriction endonuclease domain-containing protein n=1 Tax=Saccharospirillum alexandrii TaxID=2448477 RepID=UPI00373560FD
MKNKIVSIRKVVNYLNNEEYDGGFWLPNIQRPFVWDTEQIEKLFDSIMREYPISTLLVWRTNSTIRRRKFIDCYSDGLKLSQYQVPEDKRTKLLVLDGQQRLQSLFIGLKGSYNKKELYFNVFSGQPTSAEEMRYKFRFLLPSKAIFPWVNFKKLVLSNSMPNDVAVELEALAKLPLSDDQRRQLMRNVWKVHQVFVAQEAVSYQELDSVDDPDLYQEDDVVEIFIRANSGGTKLGKSDLLFSLLTASWDDADDAMEVLLSELNATGYKFTRDFILKTCLVLLGKGAAYDVKKFRDEETRQQIIDKWDYISAAIKDVRDFLYGKTFIRTDHALPSYLGMIPVIYFRYHFPDKWTSVRRLDTYFLRTLLSGAFSGRPDGLIDKCVRGIKEEGKFDVKEIFGVIHDDGRNLDVSADTLLGASYGSKTIHLIFNLWYRQFDYAPTYEGNLPQIDHIFPQSRLKDVKDANPETGRQSLMRYPAAVRDQIANCMLLSKDENGFQAKNDTFPSDWFADKSESYLDMHLIPRHSQLWEFSNYEAFIEARKELILEKFQHLLDGANEQAEALDGRNEKQEDEHQNYQTPSARVEVIDRTTVSTVESVDVGLTRTEEIVSQPSSRNAENLPLTTQALMEEILVPIAPPTKYIAGFRTADGKEIAYERGKTTITLWTQPVDLEGAEIEPVRSYEPHTPRNSNLNRKNTPALKLGNPALVWHLYDTDELLDFINWYSNAELMNAEVTV